MFPANFRFARIPLACASIISIAMFAASQSRAEDAPPAAVSPAKENGSATPSTSDSRRSLTALYAVSPVGYFIPLKHGPVFTWKASETWSIEGAYFGGSLSLGIPFVEIGSFSEKLILVQARKFRSQSFNWIIGLSYQDYEAKLGDDMIGRLSGSTTSAEVLRVSSVGLQIGFGQRFEWSNGFVLGIDWLTLNVPVSGIRSEAPALEYVTNDLDRQRLEDVLSFMRRIPTAATLKIALGYSF